MTVYAVIPLVCLIVCVFIGAFVFSSDPKRAANRIFAVITLFAAGHALVEFGFRQSRDFGEAMIWARWDSFWVVMLGLLIPLILSLTERKSVLTKWWFVAANYAPAILFLVVDISTRWVSGPPKHHSWGWSFGTGTSNVWIALNIAWDLSIYLTVLGLAIVAYRSADNSLLRRQYRTFVLGIALTLAGTAAELAFSQFHVDVPPLLTPSITALYLFFAWGVLRHQMFQLSTMSAAETIVTTMTDALFLVGDDGRIMSGNPAALKMLRYRKGELTGKHLSEVFAVRQAIPQWISDGVEDGDSDVDVTERQELVYLETTFTAKNGGVVPVSIACTVLKDNRERRRGTLLIARDMIERRRIDEELGRYRDHLEDLVRTRTAELTASLAKLQQETEERKRAEEGRREIEAQLMHAQKMEAVGRLAGSVAHDFNNLLFVILGYTESFLLVLDREDPMRSDAEQMHTAARRAESLVAQLLAFSRKQAVRPRVIDLNAEIAEVEKLFVRLLGADVKLVFERSPENPRVRIDVGQLGQVITNLVVNARDAMPDGGALIISTGAVEISEADCAQNPEAKAGRHAIVRVRDTGHGMNRELLSRIFEPYFTTKGRGKGTGLGLSTVYGIVKQNGGFITVRSEPGKGTVFEIALPQTSEGLEIELPETDWVNVRGQERILLVEDDEIVRRLVKRLLLRQGYQVQEARNAEDAVRIFEETKETIDLLFTDVVMPGMNGKQLSEHLLSHRPGLRILFMSAQNEELVARYGITGFGEKLLQKPFTANELSSKVREALEA